MSEEVLASIYRDFNFNPGLVDFVTAPKEQKTNNVWEVKKNSIRYQVSFYGRGGEYCGMILCGKNVQVFCFLINFSMLFSGCIFLILVLTRDSDCHD